MTNAKEWIIKKLWIFFGVFLVLGIVSSCLLYYFDRYSILNLFVGPIIALIFSLLNVLFFRILDRVSWSFGFNKIKPLCIVSVLLCLLSLIFLVAVTYSDIRKNVYSIFFVGASFFINVSMTALFLRIFLIRSDFETEEEVTFDNFELKRVEMHNPNHDNEFVTLKNLFQNESYFSDLRVQSEYDVNADEIGKLSCEFVKKYIFEMNLENILSGYWFLSRVDFESGVNPSLLYIMTFTETKCSRYHLGIKKVIKQYENPYCRFIVRFAYDGTKDFPFEFKEIIAEDV